MPDQLSVTNQALGHLGERELTATELATGATEPARVMASAWPAAVDECLSMAPWRAFSRRAMPAAFGASDGTQLDYAAPGFAAAWRVPDDHLRTNWVRATADPNTLPIDFIYQDGAWHTNTGSLCASYVSHAYRDPTLWTPLFSKLVAAYLAWSKRTRIRPAADAQEMKAIYDIAFDAATTSDASEMPFAWKREGRLARSRGGGYRGPQGYYS